MNDPKASSADRGWLKNDARHIKYGNKSGLRLPRNGRKSPGRKAKDKGYELAHPYNAPASKGNNYSGAKLKNHADHLDCIDVGTNMKSMGRMHEKQIENLLKQTPHNRYEYFIRYCADFEQVWGLVVGEDNWVIFKDDNGDEIFPLWSHPDLADTCCFDEHRKMGAIPQAIDLDSFIQNCIPDMESAGVYFGIFYDKLRVGLVVTSEELKIALEEEGSAWDG